MHHKPRPTPSLADLRVHSSWLWLHCPQCHHKRAVALTRYVIMLGADESSNTLRRISRCGVCGGRGAMTHVPSYVDADAGFAMFPA